MEKPTNLEEIGCACSTVFVIANDAESNAAAAAIRVAITKGTASAGTAMVRAMCPEARRATTVVSERM